MSDDTPDTQPTGEPAICAAARAIGNVCETDDAYKQVVDPAGSPSEEAQVAHGVSSCELLAAFLLGWRGRFVADTIQTTLRALWGGTGRAPDNDNICSIGAQVMWAADPATGSPLHVDACVFAVLRTSLNRVTITALAGGQRVTQADIDAGTFQQSALGLRCIKTVVRVVDWDGSGWVDQGDGRRVLGVHDP